MSMSDFWALQRAGFRAAGTATKLTGKALHGAVQAGRYTVDAAESRRLRSMAAGGVLGPGDGPAPPGSDVLDYRGLADSRSTFLVQNGLPVGNLLDVRRGPVMSAHLPMDSIVQHACVVGPSGSGKTYSIIAPWIVSLLTAGFSVATIDVKGDLLREVQECSAQRGRKTGARGIVWDYNASRTHRWNFLKEIKSSRGVDAAALSLLGKQKENDSQPFFYQRDYRWLKGLIRLAIELYGSKVEPRHLIELLTDPDALDALVPTSAARFDLYDLASSTDYSTVISGLMNVLSLFGDPTVAPAVAESDFTLEDVMSRPTLLIGVAKLSDGRRAEQMSSLLLSQLTLTILERFGSHTPRPFAFVIDEAPRLKQRLDLEELLSIARGARVGVCLAAQDVSQFGNEGQQSSILANCKTYISMAGVSPASADYFGKRLGSRQKEEFTVTQAGKRGLFEPPSRTTQTSLGPVLGPREIMYPPYGPRSAIVHSTAVAAGPIMVELSR